MPAAHRAAPGFSPLDEALGLLPGALTPPLQNNLSRLGARLSFAEAAAELAALRGVTGSAVTARRRTEGDGAVMVTLEEAEVEALRQSCPVTVAGSAVQQLSVDGVLAPLVGGEWGEVKLLAIGTVEPDQGAARTRTTALSYFGRRTEADAFAELARGEIHRRGVETAGVVAAVNDGAPWCQGVVDLHRPDAVRILDVAHASQRLTDVATAVWGEGETATAWATRWREELRDGDPAAPSPADDLPPAAAARETVLGYF